ncbi:MAG TPA: protein FdrA [Actinomycetes bacterium]|nr:protein FdrA [Actinomycetes bacterium]
MTVARTRVHPATYLDSVRLMAGSRAMLETPGVAWAGALMGTPANLQMLESEGFGSGELPTVGANDLVLAVRAASAEAAGAALATAERALLGEPGREPQAGRGCQAGREPRPRTLDEGLALLPGANTAVVSVPGPYAVLEAHKALSAGLHVLLFSDNVPVEQEAALKARAQAAGRLVMGPGAGTAMLGGIGLGFANAVARGPVGIVAAAGTGAQEVMSLLDRWGAGVSHVIGVGGRDLSRQVGGRMARLAIEALERDEATEAILLVSKPPDEDVAAAVLDTAGTKPLVAVLIGLDAPIPERRGVTAAATAERGVLDVLAKLGRSCPDPGAGLAEAAGRACARLAPGRRAVRGVFSGGTLCYEAMVVLSARLGPVHSNTPLRPAWGLPAPPAGHICLDVGEEEFTRGRPHPMLDPGARTEPILREGRDPSTAVVLVDVVLGHGVHPDPAGVLAPACAEVMAQRGGPQVVAYVLGTDRDPQGRWEQCRKLLDAGCIVVPTAARGAVVAAAVAARRPETAGGAP